MKVLFDNRIFSIQKYGGVSRYFCEILKRFPGEIWETSTIFSNNEYIKNQNLIKHFSFLPNMDFKGKSTVIEYLNRPYTIYKTIKSDFDIFHQTDFASYYFDYLKGKKVVTTFHDMNYSKFRDSYKKSLTNDVSKFEFEQRKSLERADRIIAVSLNTKNDLVNFWNINPDKISVIYHGVDKKKIDNLENERVTVSPYILYVGERNGFKNFLRFLNAFSIINKKYNEYKLVCTGRPFSNEENLTIEKLNLSKSIIQVSADERTLARLYRDAEMFVYPSLSEGFGMPVLESMVYGCPVVVSNTSSIPEVAGDAGLYFNPESIVEMVERMDSLICSETLREKMIGLCSVQLEKFSWEKSAEEHISLYKSML